MISSIIISNEAAKFLKAGRLWFSKRDVVGREPKIPQIVNLLNKRRQFIGKAFLSPDSKYYLRVFTSHNEKIDKEFWRNKIKAAYKKRNELSKLTNAYRVVHAESDGIPAVVIDKYDDVWSIQITSAGAEIIKKDLLDIITEEFVPAAIIEKNNSSIRKPEGLETKDHVVFGSKTIACIREGNQSFEVDVLAGQKTGAYLDYRDIRLKAGEFAHGNSLDAFCYQGWFACQVAAKAKKIIAVDSSQTAITAAEKNSILNKHNNIIFIKADVLEYLKECRDKFDFIHLDPPSFAKGAGKLGTAMKGYYSLVGRTIALIKPGGIIMVSSCSHAATAKVLEKILLKSVGSVGLKGKIIYRGTQASDHPTLKGHPESSYLSALAVRVRIKSDNKIIKNK